MLLIPGMYQTVILLTDALLFCSNRSRVATHLRRRQVLLRPRLLEETSPRLHLLTATLRHPLLEVRQATTPTCSTSKSGFAACPI
jgi:hypothetical protein